MATQNELDHLLQTDWREQVIPNLGSNHWLIAYLYTDHDELNWKKIHLGLIPNAEADAAIESHDWLFDQFDFEPCVRVNLRYQSGTPAFQYSRFGFAPNNMEPLIMERYTGNPETRSIELAEEFRMFHNLYVDKSGAQFRMTDDSGNEVTVVKWSQHFVQVRRQELREFAAAKNMSMIFHYIQYTGVYSSLSDLSISDSLSVEKDTEFTYLFQVDDWRGRGNSSYQSSSYLKGKAIKRMSHSQIQRIAKRFLPTNTDDRDHEKFIIGVDNNDNHIMCSPTGISHSTSKSIQDSAGNTITVSYATPVFFKPSVIEKYKRQSSRYTLGDGFVQCGGFWSLRADTNRGDYVIALIGDLKSLPSSEQSYWKSFNVEPDGSVSRTWYQRNVKAQFTDPEDSSLRFKDAYERLSDAWHLKYDWHLFTPLAKPDAHHFKMLARPLHDETIELSEIAVSLSKLLPEGINRLRLLDEIKAAHPGSTRALPKKPFAVLKEFLNLKGYQHTQAHLDYLEKVQLLRSTSASHRTDNMPGAYNQVVKFFGLDSKSTTQVADEIFTTLTDFLDCLRAHFCPDDAT